VPRFLEVAALIVLAIDLAGVAMLIALVTAPQACARLITRLSRRWPTLQRRALSAFETFVHGLDGIRTSSHILPLLGWTIVVWLTPALAAWTVLFALDLHLPFVAAWAVLAFVGLGISIPSASFTPPRCSPSASSACRARPGSATRCSSTPARSCR
jgi:hypothetical protein